MRCIVHNKKILFDQYSMDSSKLSVRVQLHALTAELTAPAKAPDLVTTVSATTP